ncbi:MAG: hypothetical protein KDI68_12875 [Gammaproteobacteria bacterium]|nr:hypothetical protein [Gammaproteobacteria bacterium]
MKKLGPLLLLLCLLPTLGWSGEKSESGGFWSSVKQTGSTVWGGVKDSGKRLKDGWDGKKPDKPMPDRGEKREGLEAWQKQ